MKVYKKYNTAKRHSNGMPILKVGEFYITDIESLTQITLVDPTDGSHLGFVIAKHLNRLGNANYAIPSDSNLYKHKEYKWK